MPVGAVVIWLIKHFLFGRFGQQDQSYVLFLQADLFPYGSPLHAAPLFWVWVFVGLLGTLVIVGAGSVMSDAGGRLLALTVIAILAAMGFSAFAAWSALWDADKQAARYYAQDTVFSVTGVDVLRHRRRSGSLVARPADRARPQGVRHEWLRLHRIRRRGLMYPHRRATAARSPNAAVIIDVGIYVGRWSDDRSGTGAVDGRRSRDDRASRRHTARPPSARECPARLLGRPPRADVGRAMPRVLRHRRIRRHVAQPRPARRPRAGHRRGRRRARLLVRLLRSQSYVPLAGRAWRRVHQPVHRRTHPADRRATSGLRRADGRQRTGHRRGEPADARAVRGGPARVVHPLAALVVAAGVGTHRQHPALITQPRI